MITKLDKTDREILNILTVNGRESFTKISEKLTFSDTGIKKRLSKLNKEGILKIQSNISLDALHFKACLILLEVKSNDDLSKIIDVYKSCPYIFLTIELIGNFNLLMGFYGNSIEDLDKKIRLCGPLNMQGVLHSEIILISNFKLPHFLPLKILLENNIKQFNNHFCKKCCYKI